jgi:hypothetical protein
MGPLKNNTMWQQSWLAHSVLSLQIEQVLSIFWYLTTIQLLEDNGCKKLTIRNLIFGFMIQLPLEPFFLQCMFIYIVRSKVVRGLGSSLDRFFYCPLFHFIFICLLVMVCSSMFFPPLYFVIPPKTWSCTRRMNQIDLLHEISIIVFLQFGKFRPFSFHAKSFAYIKMPFFRLKNGKRSTRIKSLWLW